MGQYSDLVPVLLFVVAFYVSGQDILLATGVLLVAATVQLVVQRVLQGRFERRQLWLYAVLMGLGGTTLVLQDKTFIQWKPTIIYWAMGGALFVGQVLGGERSPLQRMLGGQLELPAPVWRTLSFGWAAGFGVAGALNLWVAAEFSEATWVNFKLFGSLGLSLLFVLITVAYLGALGHLADPEEAREAGADGESGAAGSRGDA